MSTLTTLLQTTSISLSLLAAGGIATLSAFDVPILQSQPASRALPSIRWLFSRGSHVFPTIATLSAGGFVTLALRHALIDQQQSASSSILQQQQLLLPLLLTILSGRGGTQTNGYLAAGLLSFAIAPFTMLIMIPNNFALIRKNAEKGGARSAKAAREGEGKGNGNGNGNGTLGETYASGDYCDWTATTTSSPSSSGRDRTAEDSVRGMGEGHEFTDLSGPQGRTEEASSVAEDEEVREMLGVFKRQNMVRAVLIGAGGIAGLVTALVKT